MPPQPVGATLGVAHPSPPPQRKSEVMDNVRRRLHRPTQLPSRRTGAFSRGDQRGRICAGSDANRCRARRSYGGRTNYLGRPIQCQKTLRPMAAAGRSPTPWKCRTTGAAGITSFRCGVEDQGGKFVRRGRRTAESRGFFIVRPAGPHERSHPLPASYQYLQRLQQLGRLQLVQLSRPRRLARTSRLLRPSNGRAVRPLGTRLCRVGGRRRIRARLLRQFRSRMASRTVGQLPARAERGAR